MVTDTFTFFIGVEEICLMLTKWVTFYWKVGMVLWWKRFYLLDIH